MLAAGSFARMRLDDIKHTDSVVAQKIREGGVKLHNRPLAKRRELRRKAPVEGVDFTDVAPRILLVKRARLRVKAAKCCCHLKDHLLGKIGVKPYVGVCAILKADPLAELHNSQATLASRGDEILRPLLQTHADRHEHVCPCQLCYVRWGWRERVRARAASKHATDAHPIAAHITNPIRYGEDRGRYSQRPGKA